MYIQYASYSASKLDVFLMFWTGLSELLENKAHFGNPQVSICSLYGKIQTREVKHLSRNRFHCSALHVFVTVSLFSTLLLLPHK